MWDFCKNHKKALEYLPCEREFLRLPRSYIADIIHTTVGEPFAKWVEDKIEERHLAVKKAQEDDILIDPELLEVFKKSNHKSSKCSTRSTYFVGLHASFIMFLLTSFCIGTNGRAVNILKAGSKRRRTKREIMQEAEEAEKTMQKQ